MTLRVLAVDDHPLNSMLVKKLLLKFGFLPEQVDYAEDGAQAVAMYQKGSYDVVLMDCQMPVMDGYEATGRIREIQEETGRTVPILAMTANAMAGDRARCIAAGMDDYISKPIEKDKFRNLLCKWLGGHDDDPGEEGEVCEIASPDPDPVDMEHVAMFTDGDVEDEKELFALFLEQADLNADTLKKLVADEAAAEWKSTAHRFKGAG